MTNYENIDVNKLDGFYKINNEIYKIYGYTFDINTFNICMQLFNQSNKFYYRIIKIKKKNIEAFKKYHINKLIINRRLKYEDGEVEVYLPNDLYNTIKEYWLYILDIESIVSNLIPIELSVLNRPYTEILSMYGLLSLSKLFDYDSGNIFKSVFSIDTYYYDDKVKILPNELNLFISYIHDNEKIL